MKKIFPLLMLHVFIGLFAPNVFSMENYLLEIKVKPISFVENEKVSLGDIALVYGNDANQVEEAKSIFIATAPHMGRSILMNKTSINNALLKNGLDPNKIKITFPNKITIKNKMTRVSKAEIKESIKKYIYENMPWDRDQVKITQTGINRDIFLPGKEITQTIVMGDNSNYIGKIPLSIEFKENDNILKRIRIRVVMKVLLPVVSAKTFINKGHIISENDFVIEEKWISKTATSAIYASENEIIGKKVKRNIKAGQLLSELLLETPPDIEKGDRVTILAASNSFRVTTPGIAGEKGIKGQTIKVRNISSKKTIYAKVINSSVVAVNF